MQLFVLSYCMYVCNCQESPEYYSFAVCLTMNFFLAEIIICIFSNTLEKCASGNLFYIVARAQYFTTLI